jgi:glycosyltransferase involved in cell wall biosynthesis
VIALLAGYNEERFLACCIEHLRDHGIESYLIDHCSTDSTVAIAERYLGHGLLGIEELPREDGVFSLREQLRRKEELAHELESDWFIHLDPDELRIPPSGGGTLVQALEEVDSAGCNAVNFLELSFVPTREEPDHDHPEFERTLRTYYPLLPEFPHRLSAWKATDEIDLVSKAGHRVRFPGLKQYPESFLMKHYLFLSVPHLIEKYAERKFDRDEVEAGWHGWRDGFRLEDIRLPSQSELRITRSDADLDASAPRLRHFLAEP